MNSWLKTGGPSPRALGLLSREAAKAITYKGRRNREIDRVTEREKREIDKGLSQRHVYTISTRPARLAAAHNLRRNFTASFFSFIFPSFSLLDVWASPSMKRSTRRLQNLLKLLPDAREEPLACSARDCMQHRRISGCFWEAVCPFRCQNSQQRTPQLLHR